MIELAKTFYLRKIVDKKLKFLQRRSPRMADPFNLKFSYVAATIVNKDRGQSYALGFIYFSQCVSSTLQIFICTASSECKNSLKL